MENKPPAGFCYAQSQIIPETQYLAPYLPNSTRGRFLPNLSLGYRLLTSRGFLSRSITKQSRNPIPHHLLSNQPAGGCFQRKYPNLFRATRGVRNGEALCCIPFIYCSQPDRSVLYVSILPEVLRQSGEELCGGLSALLNYQIAELIHS